MVSGNDLAVATLEQPEERAARVRNFKTHAEMVIERRQEELRKLREQSDKDNERRLNVLCVGVMHCCDCAGVADGVAWVVRRGWVLTSRHGICCLQVHQTS